MLNPTTLYYYERIPKKRCLAVVVVESEEGSKVEEVAHK
jgi:hypothetical protein